MKIEKVILQNIGVYVNYNEFDLRAEKPIILIGGMNGRGKTTFLDSILFTLYGQRAIVNAQNLEGYLRKISNITGNDTQCFAEMQFTTLEQGETTFYRVRRTWDLKKKNLKMKTHVWREEIEDETLSSNWDMFVEEILPRSIASFFFFDGEKMSELAASESDSYIQSSIISLLGIDVINQLLTDLKAVSSSVQKSISKEQHQDKLNMLESQLEELRTEKHEKEQLLSTEQRELRDLEIYISSLEETYTMTGGEYVEHQRNLEHQRKKLLLQLEDVEAQMMELAGSSLPLKLVEDLINDVEQSAKEEQKQKELDVFVRRLPVLYRDYSNNTAWDNHMEEFYESIKGQIVEGESVYQLDDDTIAQLGEMNQLLKNDTDRVKQLIKQKQQLNEEIETIENYLAVKVENDNLAEIYEKIKEASAKRGAKLLQIETQIKQQAELEQQEEALEKAIKQILNLVVSEMENADENLRILSYIEKQSDILTEYKSRLQALKSKELGGQMTICFQQLIAKDGLIKRIEINPETLEFHYYGRDGYETDRQKFSSGEKQLLVIAILWALSICSRSEFPLIIDTPLARLDSVHRMSLLENYFPKASEQVIILSTDQEITRQDYEVLKQHIGKEYTLIYDEKTMSSSIHEGYFGGNEA